MILYTRKHRVPFEIDERDFAAVSQHTWCVDARGYPCTRIGKRTIKLHLLLLGKAPAGLEWDHIDRNKLNNQRGNLRAVSRTVNIRNTGKNVTNTSGVKGVYWHRIRNKWAAQIRAAGRARHLGLFHCIEAATAARLAAEKTLWKGDR